MEEAFVKLLFAALLCTAGVWDLLHRRIPDWVCAGILAAGALAALLVPGMGLRERLFGGLAVSVPMLLISLWVPGAFGGGDLKLTAAGGFFLGTAGILEAFALAMAGSGAAGLCLLAAGRKRERGKGEGRLRIPIGPFLCAGMLAALYCGKGGVLS